MNNEESEVKEEENGKMLYILQKDTLTLKEACFYLGISVSFMYKLTHGRLITHYVPNGKLIYFKRSELDEWLHQNRRSSRYEVEQRADRYSLRSGSKK